MCMNEITFDKLPEAVAYLIKEVSQIRELVEVKQVQPKEKRKPIAINEACRLVMKAKPTIYALVRKGLIPCYKNGKKLYFYEDELLAWIEKGKKKTNDELRREIEAEMQPGRKYKMSSNRY